MWEVGGKMMKMRVGTRTRKRLREEAGLDFLPASVSMCVREGGGGRKGEFRNGWRGLMMA